ncbi:MAG: hypothetical protein ACI9H8_000323 [Lysobacterales bacterium]
MPNINLKYFQGYILPVIVYAKLDSETGLQLGKPLADCRLRDMMNIKDLNRNFLQIYIVASIMSSFSLVAQAGELSIERLTWAGIKLVSGDTTVFIDAVGTDLWEMKP